MDISQDIYSVEDFRLNPDQVVDTSRSHNRPALIAKDGKPDFLIIPVELLGNKQTALEAACELLETV